MTMMECTWNCISWNMQKQKLHGVSLSKYLKKLLFIVKSLLIWVYVELSPSILAVLKQKHDKRYEHKAKIFFYCIFDFGLLAVIKLMTQLIFTNSQNSIIISSHFWEDGRQQKNFIEGDDIKLIP